jgi:hypothetical protein
MPDILLGIAKQLKDSVKKIKALINNVLGLDRLGLLVLVLDFIPEPDI